MGTVLNNSNNNSVQMNLSVFHDPTAFLILQLTSCVLLAP